LRIRDEDEAGEPEFSMAPLIDVVFQMLIFFLVATSWANREHELEIELPAAASATLAEAQPEELVIDVRRDGSCALRGRVVDAPTLAAELGDYARANASRPVTIRGDRLAHHESVVAVLDACGQAGLSNLAVSTLDRP